MEKIETSEFDEQLVLELDPLLKDGLEKEYLAKLDEFLAKVKIIECGEKMVSFESSLPPTIFVDLVDLKIEVGDLDRNQLREGIIVKLIEAQNSLPEGMHLVIRDAFRSKEVVQKLYERYVRLLIEKENITEEEADVRVRFLLAMPDDIVPPGHMTGGAIDVVLAYDDGRRVEMEVNEGSIPRSKQSWTACDDLPEEIKNNRKILLDAMIGAGFRNYAREYWHYSYGDAYWAVRRKEKVAIYGIPK